MQSLFRSRIPPQLTSSQINKLSNQSNLAPEEIEEWYDRFVLCYPYGYVSYNQFLIYLKQLNIYNGHQHEQLSKLIIKQLFCMFDSNGDKQLNFKEFFRLNLLISQGSNEDKIKLILNLYDRKQKKYYTQQQIVNNFTNLFHLLNISEPVDSLSGGINTILTQRNLINRKNKINWNLFCTSVLKHSSLFELFFINNFHEENLEGQLTTRL